MTKTEVRAKRAEKWAARMAHGYRTITLHTAPNEYQMLATHGLAQGPAAKKFLLDQLAAGRSEVDQKKLGQDLAVLRAEQARLKPQVVALRAEQARLARDIQILKDLRDQTAVEIAQMRQEAQALVAVALYGAEDIRIAIAKATSQN